MTLHKTKSSLLVTKIEKKGGGGEGLQFNLNFSVKYIQSQV